jgi:hypothetical protein
MFGQTKTTLLFAGAILLATALFATAFQVPQQTQAPPAYSYNAAADYQGDDDSDDVGEGDGEGSGDAYPYADDGGSGAGAGAFGSDDAIIDDTQGFDPVPVLSTDGIDVENDSEASTDGGASVEEGS